MLAPDVIQIIEAFLNRVQLQGNEVPAFNRVMMALAAARNEHQRQQPNSSGPGNVVALSAVENKPG